MLFPKSKSPLNSGKIAGEPDGFDFSANRGSHLKERFLMILDSQHDRIDYDQFGALDDELFFYLQPHDFVFEQVLGRGKASLCSPVKNADLVQINVIAKS